MDWSVLCCKVRFGNNVSMKNADNLEFAHIYRFIEMQETSQMTQHNIALNSVYLHQMLGSAPLAWFAQSCILTGRSMTWLCLSRQEWRLCYNSAIPTNLKIRWLICFGSASTILNILWLIGPRSVHNISRLKCPGSVSTNRNNFDRYALR